MIGEYAQIAYYVCAVFGAVGTVALAYLSTKFVPKSDFAAFKEETEKRFSAGRDKMAELTTLFTRIDAALQNLPKKDDMHELALAIKGLDGNLLAMRTETKAQGDEIDQLRATLTRHEDILSQGGRS